MKSRMLGRSGIEVSPMGIGCWAIGGSNWGGGADDDESIRGIHKALEMGMTFFDTADAYGSGRSERVLGKALAGRREQVVIATKFGFTATGSNAEPDYIRSACEASLKRLNTDYIDLYQFHLNDYDPEHAEKSVRRWRAWWHLARSGRMAGVPTFPIGRTCLHKGQTCSAIQMKLKIIDDAPDMLTVCEECNLAAINRSPLAMGLLTGKYTPGKMLPEDDVRGPRVRRAG